MVLSHERGQWTDNRKWLYENTKEQKDGSGCLQSQGVIRQINERRGEYDVGDGLERVLWSRLLRVSFKSRIEGEDSGQDIRVDTCSVVVYL